MAIATLDAIRFKIRKLTGSGTANQLTDSQINDYINSYYLYDLPAAFRSLKLKDYYTFDTIQNQDTYTFDSEKYTTVDNPCYCMNREIKLFQDPWSFYAANFNWQFQNNFSTGDGTTGPYTGLASSVPLLRSVNNDPTLNTYPAGRIQNILITANTATSTLNVTDDGFGNLIGDCLAGGTINYFTGAIAGLFFTSGVPQGNSIQIQYNPFQPSIPLGILFYQNQFVLRPVPNMGYTIQMVAYRQPVFAIENSTVGSSVPEELKEWWEILAYGAALKIYEDRVDQEGIAMMEQGLQKRYRIVEARTYAQIGTQRVNTLFADQIQYNYGSGGWGFGNASP